MEGEDTNFIVNQGGEHDQDQVQEDVAASEPAGEMASTMRPLTPPVALNIAQAALVDNLQDTSGQESLELLLELEETSDVPQGNIQGNSQEYSGNIPEEVRESEPRDFLMPIKGLNRYEGARKGSEALWTNAMEKRDSQLRENGEGTEPPGGRKSSEALWTNLGDPQAANFLLEEDMAAIVNEELQTQERMEEDVTEFMNEEAGQGMQGLRVIKTPSPERLPTGLGDEYDKFKTHTETGKQKRKSQQPKIAEIQQPSNSEIKEEDSVELNNTEEDEVPTTPPEQLSSLPQDELVTEIRNSLDTPRNRQDTLKPTSLSHDEVHLNERVWDSANRELSEHSPRFIVTWDLNIKTKEDQRQSNESSQELSDSSTEATFPSKKLKSGAKKSIKLLLEEADIHETPRAKFQKSTERVISIQQRSSLAMSSFRKHEQSLVEVIEEAAKHPKSFPSTPRSAWAVADRFSVVNVQSWRKHKSTKRKDLKGILLTDDKKEQRRELNESKKHVRFINIEVNSRRYLSLGIFNPESDPRAKLFLDRWELIMLIALTYETWAFPFRLAIGSPNFSTVNLRLLMFDVAMDSLFLIEALFIMNTVVTITAPQQSGKEKDVIRLVKRTDIATYHMWNTFPRTLLPCLVVYLFGLYISRERDNKPLALSDIRLWLWWLSTVPRLTIRGYRLVRYYKKMELELEVNIYRLQLFKFTCMIFLACHWVGCLFYYLSRLADFNNQTWIYRLQFVLHEFDFDSSSQPEHYTIMLYKGFNMLANLGYESLSPNNEWEVIWSILVMFAQVGLSAYILGTLFNYLVQKDAVSEEHYKHMKDVEEFMEARNLPAELRNEMRQHFDFQFRKRVENKASTLIQLPHSLEVKVASAQYKTNLDKCNTRGGVFFGCNDRFLNAIIIKLQEKYLMPSEFFVSKGDMSRELCFVLDGSVQAVEASSDGEVLLRTIRGNIPEVPSIVGEVAFFMGITNPDSIRARTDGDVKLLTLSKQDYEDLVTNYPEQHDKIVGNLLVQFSINKQGDAEANGYSNGEEVDDPRFLELKESIRIALKRRTFDDFSAVMFAAQRGDVEECAQILRRGLDINMKDYDGRTTLHMAAKKGMFKVVELLLEQGADKNAVDRWGNAPLQVALLARQGPVAELLTEWNASLQVGDPAGALCDAASTGDIAMVQRLLDNGVDPNVGDYDSRTPFHLAAAEGQQKVVEYLLNAKADVNVKDRWGGTPLMDAVASRHPMLSRMIFQAGGTMPSAVEAEKLCAAAGEGDVPLLGLLADCDCNLDAGDYDGRCALHLAAAEAQILAVSFLLSHSANPNCTDRWGGTPLVDALRGGTMYHSLCARLIASAGGKLGILEGTQEGDELMERLSQIDIFMTRDRQHYLIKHGYHKKKPSIMHEQDVLTCLEANFALIRAGASASDTIQNIMEFLDGEHGEELVGLSSSLPRQLVTLGRKLDAFTSSLRAAAVEANGASDGATGSSISVNDHLWQKNCADLMPRKLFKTFLEGIFEDPNLDVETFFVNWAGEKLTISESDAADADRRAAGFSKRRNSIEQLYEEMDDAENTVSQTLDTIARQFQKSVMQFFRVEQAVLTTQEAFQVAAQEETGTPHEPKRKNSASDQPQDAQAELDELNNCKIGIKQIPTMLSMLGLEYVQQDTVEAIVMESRNHQASKSSHHLPRVKVSAFAVIASSGTFHRLFTDSDYGDENLEGPQKEIKKGLELMQSVWNLMLDSEKWCNPEGARQGGVKTVQLRTLKKVNDKLGEVGMEIFTSVFLKPMKRYAAKVTQEKKAKAMESNNEEDDTEEEAQFLEEEVGLDFDQFMNFWLNHITGQEQNDGLPEKKKRKSLLGSALSGGSFKKRGANSSDEPDHFLVEIAKRLLSTLISNFRTHHSMRQVFFTFENCQRYEASFVKIAGSLDTPLKFKDLTLFMEVTFAEHTSKYGITARNRSEFLKAFKLPKYAPIPWSEMRKVVVREKENKTKVEQGNLFLPGGLFNSSSRAMRIWENVVTPSAAFVFVMVPFDIAFQPDRGVDTFSFWACNSIQDIVFVLDLFFKFNTAYRNKRSMLVLDRNKIAKHYLANDFVIDLAAAFPFDVFVLALGVSSNVGSWLRLPKLLRIRRVWIWIKERIGTNSNFAVFVRLLCQVGVVLHYCACVWYGLGQLKNKPTWFSMHEDQLCTQAEKLTEENRCDVLAEYGARSGSSLMDKYMLSLYWTTATMLGSGLVGSVLPTNFEEVVFTICVLFLNMAMVAYAVGEIGNMVMNADAQIVSMREEMLAVQSYITSKNLSPDLQSEVKAHIYASQSGSAIDMGWLFSALSYTLQVKVATNLSRRFLEKVLLFKKCSDNFMDSLSVLLREEHYSPEEYIFRCNEISREMYFVVQGYLELLNETEDGEVLDGLCKPGDSCGDLSFFFGIRHISTVRVQAAGAATLFRLQKSDFSELLKLYPEEEHLIAKNALSVFDKTSAKMSGGSQSQSQAADSDAQSAAPSAMSRSSAVFDDIVGGKVSEAIKVLKSRRKSDRINLLFEAIRRGDLEDVQNRLNGGDIFVNETNSDNRGALHIAASEGALEIVKLLLTMGADVSHMDNFMNTPLNDAVRHEHDRVAALLRMNHGVVLQLQGADAAVKLCEAASTGNIVGLRRLIENGVDVNDSDYDKRSALHLAAAEGHVEAVQYLLDQGADVDATDRFGGLPLEDAIRHGHTAVQRQLVEAGSKLQGLSMACKMCDEAANGNVEEIQVLVKCGVFANIADYDSRTALHLAASNDCNNVLYYLLNLEPKIDPNPVDRLGGTPLTDAIRHGNKVAQAQLEKVGGLQKGDPQLDSIQEQQNLRRQKEEKEAREPKVNEMIKKSPENARIGKIRELFYNLQECVPPLCSQCNELLAKINQMVGILEAVMNDWNKPQESGSELNMVSQFNSRSKDGKKIKFDMRHLQQLQACAKAVASSSNEVLEYVSEAIHEPRVYQLQPNWPLYLPSVKDEVQALSALSSIMDKFVEYVLKDVVSDEIPSVRPGIADGSGDEDSYAGSYANSFASSSVDLEALGNAAVSNGNDAELGMLGSYWK